MRIRWGLLLVLVTTAAHAANVCDPNTGTNCIAVNAKGTQGALAGAVQDLHDAGRTIQTLGSTLVAPATSETLVTMTPASGGTNGSTGTSFAVTSGKTLRLQALSCSITASSTTAVGVACYLLMSASGAVTTSSAHIATCGAGFTGTQVAQVGAGNSVSFPDGIELSGTMQYGVSCRGINTNALASVYTTGFEY